MKLSCIKVYDLEESIVASGLPMAEHYTSEGFDHIAALLEKDPYSSSTLYGHMLRAERLTRQPHGTGHDNFLSGILVSMNITATVKWWEQFQRYHFKQIVSSQSSMHRLRKILLRMDEMNIEKSNAAAEVFHPLVDSRLMQWLVMMAKDPNVDDEMLAYSCPMGLQLTARINTNYLQLRTMMLQRHLHKLQEWRDFCRALGELPYGKEFIWRDVKVD